MYKICTLSTNIKIVEIKKNALFTSKKNIFLKRNIRKFRTFLYNSNECELY